MSRVKFSVDETVPGKPVPCMDVNGRTMRLSAAELARLVSEAVWAANACQEARMRHVTCHNTQMHFYQQLLEQADTTPDQF